MTRQVRGLALALVLTFVVIAMAGNLVQRQSLPVSADPVTAAPVSSSPAPSSAGQPSDVSPSPSAEPSPSGSPVAAGAPSADASPPPTEPPPFDPNALAPVPLSPMDGAFLPDRSQHISDRYLRHYGATRVSFDQLLDRGRPLPTVSASCARSWKRAGLDRRIDGSKVDYLCLGGLAGRGFKPQGVGGSGTSDQNFWLGDQPASNRNIVITSWYASSGVTKLVVIDLDQRRYNVIELVRPAGSRTFRKLSSHGSGVVWTGQYLYSSSLSELMMYNAGDILQLGGRYVLPAVARWRVQGAGGMSSISIDRSSTPNQLQSINYVKRGRSYLQSFDLAADGSLAARSERSANDLTLINSYGGRTVHSVDRTVVPGASFQGVASLGAYDFANSSSMRLNGRKGDTAVVMKNESVVGRFRMPHGNGQSIYLDYARKSFVSVTEAGSQFLYQLPLRELTNS